MTRAFPLLSAIAVSLLAGVAFAQGVIVPKPAQTGVVFISKGDIDTAIAGRRPGMGLASLAAARAGDDRISVDVLKRTDSAAEGPVVHDVVTEIYYVLEGGGVMETGGALVDAKPMATPAGKPINPANIGPSHRGATMTGGTTHHVSAGDVVVIPPGAPHRFLSLDGSVTYLAVRVNPGYEKGR